MVPDISELKQITCFRCGKSDIVTIISLLYYDAIWHLEFREIMCIDTNYAFMILWIFRTKYVHIYLLIYWHILVAYSFYFLFIVK